MTSHTLETTFEINAATVLLKVAFNFTPAVAATGPTYYHGGLPSEPEQIEVTSLEWSRENKVTKTVQWHKIDGALFELIAEDKWLHVELSDTIDDDHIAAREDAAEQRAEFAREDRS